MKHGVKSKKLGRNKSELRCLLANMTNSLITHERIFTTLHKAKFVRPYVEKMITLGKKGGLHKRRLAASMLRQEGSAKKIFDILSLRYKDRNGGYTRIVKCGFRKGDGADMAVIELVDSLEVATSMKLSSDK